MLLNATLHSGTLIVSVELPAKYSLALVSGTFRSLAFLKVKRYGIEIVKTGLEFAAYH